MIPNPPAPRPGTPAGQPSAGATELPPEPATMPIGPSTGSDYTTATEEVPVLPYATTPQGRWTVGTLTYTSAGLVALFLVLLGGDFALSMRERSIPSITTLMLKRFHASDRTLALLLVSLPPAMSLLFVPVISFKSDRLRSRFGRRVPYLLATTPIAAGAMAALAFSEEVGHRLAAWHVGPWSANAWSLAYFGVCWTAFECAGLTSLALVQALVNDVVPRAVLGRFYGLFRAVSLIAGMLFNYSIFGYADLHYRAILIGIAVLFGVGFTLMCLKVREGQYPPPEPVDPHALDSGRRLTAVQAYLSESFREPYFRWVFASITLGAVTFLPVNTYSLYYADQVHMSHVTYGKLSALTYAISLALAWPMGWLVDRLSALFVATGCVIVYGTGMVIAGLVVHGAHSFGVALVVHGVLSGCFFTSSASLAQALLPRLKFGQYASAAGIVQSLTTMVVGPAMGQVLDLSGHNYRLTFYGGSCLAAAGAVCLTVVIGHRRPAELE